MLFSSFQQVFDCLSEKTYCIDCFCDQRTKADDGKNSVEMNEIDAEKERTNKVCVKKDEAWMLLARTAGVSHAVTVQFAVSACLVSEQKVGKYIYLRG